MLVYISNLHIYESQVKTCIQNFTFYGVTFLKDKYYFINI